ncbi:hypothetical protein [Kitasatospora azatica]|uniref:hypothetical protein n=1 Tax=Kitasatospora azatica TaxID=58347 RepID=UPI0012F7F880|nr:hypothetical protein [Kitasatospora azatica]
MRRTLGQLLLLIGLVAAATIPAQAATSSGGINPCVVLAICVEIDAPGSTGSPGGGGGSSGGGGGGTEAQCAWHGVQHPCWDPDLGWFDTTSGCYFTPEVPQPDPGSTQWEGKYGSGTVYLTTCYDAANNPTAGTRWLSKPPNVTAAPPTPGTVAQMAIKQLRFARPIEHIDPKNGQMLVGVKAWLWYETSPATHDVTVGPQSTTVSLNGVTVTATATLNSVVWDLGYAIAGVEQTVTCHGPGVPYAAGLEQNPPADACLASFDKLSPSTGAPPSTGPKPTASPSPGGGFWPVATEIWDVTTVDDNNPTVKPWPDLQYKVAGAPVQFQVNELQVLN